MSVLLIFVVLVNTTWAVNLQVTVPTESDGGIVTTLTALGVDTAGLFNSVFLVR